MGLIDKTLSLIERGAQQWRHARAQRAAWNRVQASSRAMRGSHSGRGPNGEVGESFFSRVLSSVTGGWGWPGMWARDRLEFPQHFRHWNFVAVDCIRKNIRGRTPTMAWVEDDDDQGHARSPQQKMYRYRRYEKTLGSVHPHEKITPIPNVHPLKRLWKRPNAWDTAGGSDIIDQTVMYLKLSGEAYWWLIPDQNTGLPCEWWCIPSHWCWPRMGQNGIFQIDVRPFPGGGSGTIYIPWDQIVYFQYPSPLSKIGGWSTQRAISEWIDVEDSINQSQFWTFKNVLAPQGAIELGENFQDPSDEELERIYIKFFIRFQGEFNHGKPIILPPGAKFTPLEIMPRECAFTESGEMTGDNILAAYRVPKQVAGKQDAGSEIAMWGPLCQFHEGVIKPDLTYMGQVATNQLCSRWDDRLRWWWDNPTDSSPEQRRADRAQQGQFGIVTTNEMRADFGMEPWTDEEEAKYSKLLQKQGGGMMGAPGMAGPGGPGGGPGAPSSPIMREWYDLPRFETPGYVGAPGGQPPITPERAFHVDHHLHNGRKSWSNGVDLPKPVPGTSVLAAPTTKKYGCILYPLPSPLKEKVEAMQTRLSQIGVGFSGDHDETAGALRIDQVSEEDRANHLHVTVLYGMEDRGPDKVQKALAGVKPFTLSLGAVEMFPDTGDGEVLHLKVHSDDIEALHAMLADKLPHVDMHGKYQPHVTLGYLRAGMAQKYLGLSGLEEDTITVDKLVYSSPEKMRYPLVLGGATGSVPDKIAERMQGALPESEVAASAQKVHKRPMSYEQLMEPAGNGHAGNGQVP